MKAVLCFFHCESNTGYAIQRHEYVFAMTAHMLSQDWDKVHFAYPSLASGRSDSIPDGVTKFVELDFSSTSPKDHQGIYEYIRQNDIDTAIGFDQPVWRPSYSWMRRAGIKRFVSYWGAPMSSLNSGLKLLAKRIEVALRKDKPDLFVFQSYGMRKTAVRGRGISFRKTRVVNSGIEMKRYIPAFREPNRVVYDRFDIPESRKVIYFSGHMEGRKGVEVILRAAVHAVEELGRRDLHFLFFGNKGSEADRFVPIYAHSEARHYITFGGYRNDLHEILPGCYAGVLATTGWDSFPMSTIEISAAGLPLLVSDLIGVRETVLERKTGFRFPVGDAKALAQKLSFLADNQQIRDELGKCARRRAESRFTREKQIERMIAAIRSI